MIKVKRALISVSDKNGLLDFARGLANLGIEIISTGGTARLLKGAGVNVKEVSDYTGFPEMLDGRVKTLHPAIHGGLLALRDKPEHMAQLKEHDIGLIDMVVVNLYPFERVIEKKNVHLDEAIENIDIGGPAMLRSAAKNFKNVAVLSNPSRYKEILKDLEQNSGILSDAVLINLAIEAFSHTARYDGIIYNFLNQRLRSGDLSKFAKELTLRFVKVQDLRYGENPHQAGAFYRDAGEPAGLPALKQLHGKELSFNNILDLNAAVELLREFSEPAATVIKHNNPTGVAEDKDLAKAYQAAYAGDKLSAFGGIIGLNRKVDGATAQLIEKSGFMECVIAPGFEPAALKILTKKKNIRLLELDPGAFADSGLDFKKVQGGLLLQDTDQKKLDAAALKTATKLKPSSKDIASILFGWKVIKHVRSNAIVLVKGLRAVGIGCGQTSRVDSAATALKKAGTNARGAILISEAFLPKTDTVTIAAKAGIRTIVQSGGSIADPDVIKEANRRKLVMVMTGLRHFKH